MSSTTASFKVDTTAGLTHTVSAWLYHLSSLKIKAVAQADLVFENGRRLNAHQPEFKEFMKDPASGFKNLERLTAENIVTKAKQLEENMQSSALIKSTLAEVNQLNAEALKRGIDIEPLFAVIEKAGTLAKKDSDKEAIQ